MKAAAVLPARLLSTRLPRKMLLDDTGMPLIEHSARNVLASGLFERVAVATDSDEIRERLAAAGLEVVLTRADHESGTDRVLEAARGLGLEALDVLINVQGDEPEVAREDLATLIEAFRDPSVELATLCTPIERLEVLQSPQAVKVVRDARGDALYFSRAPIPGAGHGGPGAGRANAAAGALRHVGVYAFRPRALAEFCALPRGRLERAESLEQLRWLESGRRIRVLDATHAPLGIDTRAEYDAFVARWRARVAN